MRNVLAAVTLALVALNTTAQETNTPAGAIAALTEGVGMGTVTATAGGTAALVAAACAVNFICHGGSNATTGTMSTTGTTTTKVAK